MQIFGLIILYSYRRRRKKSYEDTRLYLRRDTEGDRRQHNGGGGHRADQGCAVGAMSKDRQIRAFFDACLKLWEKRHGRKPMTNEEMWDAVNDGMERPKKTN